MTDSRVALVSGTSRGIGRALAEHFLDQGYRVIGLARGSATFERDGYRHFEVDVTDDDAVKAMFMAIRADYGRLDILVNNAAIASMNHSLLTPIETVRKILDVNVTAPFLLCREAAKLMRTTGTGRIVNMVSVATVLKLEGEAAYAASKAALVSLTEILARELAEFGITVNAVGPTPIATDLIRSVPDEKIERLIERQAIRRMGETRDVANAVDFFCRRESDFITGQTLYLGGV